MTDWPKPFEEMNFGSICHPLTLTYAGKRQLMIRARSRYHKSDNAVDKIDHAYTFFFHAFHLKEWIENFCNNDSFLINWKKNYSNNKYYLLCQDFCNKSKHLKLTRPKLTDRIGIVESHERIGNQMQYVYYARFDNRYIPLDIFMDKILNFWSEVFTKEGLS